MLLSNLRRSPTDFLIDVAVLHFKETGRAVKGFIVPTKMWDELRNEPDTVRIDFVTLDVDGFDVIASEFIAPCLVEDVTLRGVPLL